MEKINDIKLWLHKLLKEKFCINAELINKLSAVDLLYIYAEIYINFKIKLTPNDIYGDCFSSVDLLSEYICKHIIINEN